MSGYMRVTQRSIAERTLVGLQNNIGRLGQLQQQMSSGKLISKPSDSPTGTVSAMQFRSEIRTNEQWARNADDGMGWLGTIDTTLSQAETAVRSASGIVLRGLNDGAATPISRQALATELRELRKELIQQANTSYLGRPVFGGITGGTGAYDAAGTYQGTAATAANAVLRTVGSGEAVRVDLTGLEVYGDDSTGLFATLAAAADHLEAGDTNALSNDLAQIGVNERRLLGAHAEVGSRYGRMSNMKTAADDRVLDLRAGLSDVEDVDLPKTVVELQLASTAYEAALAATKRVVTPSLVDFLR